MHILEISKLSSAKTEFSFFFGIFSSVFGFISFFQYRRRCRFRFFKISRYRFRFSVTDSALIHTPKIRWRSGVSFRRYARGQTNRHTDRRHAHHSVTRTRGINMTESRNPLRLSQHCGILRWGVNADAVYSMRQLCSVARPHKTRRRTSTCRLASQLQRLPLLHRQLFITRHQSDGRCPPCTATIVHSLQTATYLENMRLWGYDDLMHCAACWLYT